MAKAKVVTIHVIPVNGKRPLSFSERVLFASPASLDVLWPVATPEYGKGEEAKARRVRNYWDAASNVDALADRLALAVASGTGIVVKIYAGTVLSGDRSRGIYGNVVSPAMLADIARMAQDVIVAAGAEDPREYVEDDDSNATGEDTF